MTQLQQKNVPALRFPEFSGEWDDTQLGKIANRQKEKNSSLEHVRVLTNSAVYGVIDQRDYFNHDIANADNLGGYYIIKKGDFVYNPRISVNAPVGPIKKNNLGTGVMSPLYSVFRFKINKTQFFEQYFSSSNWHLYMKRVANYGARHDRMAISTKDFMDMPLPYPSPDEQNKIAGFLSAVDERIEQLTRKRALVKQYKKGMMQKLFSQELRFKDKNGNPFPDWEEKPLGSLYEFKSTNSFSRDQLNYDSGEVYNIHYGDIHTKFKTSFCLTHEYIPFINSDVNLDRIFEDKYCIEGDLVIADASEDYDDIGKAIELTDLNGQKVLAGLHTLLARLLDENIYVGFGAYLMASDSVRKQIKLIAQGTKVLGISAGRMSKIKLLIPSSKKEQRKIANFLSCLDNKIDLITTELEHAQDFKKGLLQQMFV